MRNILSWNTRIKSMMSIHDAEALFDLIPLRSTSTFNVMVTTYAQVGDLSKADMVFRSIPEPDTVSFNAMLQGYIQCGDLRRAWVFFLGTPAGFRDVITWNITIRAFEFRTMFRLMPVHSIAACNIVVMAFARERHIFHARKTFKNMVYRNEIAWNCIIQALVSNGQTQEAEEVFFKMPEHTTLCWNAIIVLSLQNGNLRKSRELFRRMLHRDIVSWNAFLAAGIKGARAVFDRMPMWSVASWNALISAYANSGRDRHALQAFHSMELHGIREELETLAIVLGSCASLTSLSQGTLVHECFKERHWSESHHPKQQHYRAMVSSALINMYGKCGKIEEAVKVFEELEVPNTVVWNSMAAAFAAGGNFSGASFVFQKMACSGIDPTPSTFSILLSMCSHAGMWSQGYTYFISMRYDFLLQTSEDHFVCLVDMIARSGWLGRAEELLQCMPYEPGEVAWLALLGACSSHKDDCILPETKVWVGRNIWQPV